MNTKEFFTELADVFGDMVDSMTTFGSQDFDALETNINQWLANNSKGSPEVRQIAKILAWELPSHDDNIKNRLNKFKRTLRNLKDKIK